MYEGAPNFPEPDRFWSIIERHKVNIFYTAPTAIRTFIKWGNEWPKKHDLEQPAPAGHRRRADQSRGMDVVSRGDRPQPLSDRRYLVADRNRADHDFSDPGAIATKPGSATRPLPGIVARGRHARRQTCSRRLGRLSGDQAAVARRCCARSTAIPIATCSQYWSQIPGAYFTGDGARKDKDGYFWIMGRVDDVINVSGHRLSTMEMESALVAHRSGRRGGSRRPSGRNEGPGGRGIRHAGRWADKPTPELKEELRQWVAKEIGAMAKPDDIRFTDMLAEDAQRKNHAAPAA